MRIRTRKPRYAARKRAVPTAFITLAALCMAAGTMTAPATAATPSVTAAPRAAAVSVADDQFYVPPSPLPQGKPGDVIRARKSSVGWPSAQANAWQVMYLSTNALGQPVAMTGTVLVPEGKDTANMPIVAFGPGTQGPAFRCAPSTMISEGAFYEQSGLNDLLHAGYAVSVPDYEGYRPDPKTTYVVGKAMGPAMIDSVRAAQRLSEAKLSGSAKVAFRGYSQGGGAAMWAGELQPTYAPELNLVGVAAGGIPADLIQVALPLNGQKGFGLMATAMIGLDHAYPDLKLDSYLNDAGRKAFADINQNACAFELLVDYKDKLIEDYTTESPFLEEPWVNRVAENKLGEGTPKAPVFQYHATQDELVDFTQAKDLRDVYCGKGVKLTWKTYETDHITLVGTGNQDALDFLKARMGGSQAGSNC